MQFGTIVVTKDRNHCLERTLRALRLSELLSHPVVVQNNGSEIDNPRDVIQRVEFPCDYVDVGFNPGIVGSRVLAHRVARARGWTHYCFLQDDFELRAEKPWLGDTLAFLEKFHIDYCRLTIRESMLGENEHWVKGMLRVMSGETRWNCSHIQLSKSEQVGETQFAITDKHYGDWAHIMSAETSALLFGETGANVVGPSVVELLRERQPFVAFQGALCTEFDIAVKHWLAYALGLTSATGIVMERPSWSGLFDHFEGQSAGGRRELPEAEQNLARLTEGWTPAAATGLPAGNLCANVAAEPAACVEPIPTDWRPVQWT